MKRILITLDDATESRFLRHKRNCEKVASVQLSDSQVGNGLISRALDQLEIKPEIQRKEGK